MKNKFDAMIAEFDELFGPIQGDREEFKRRVRSFPKHSVERKTIAGHLLEIRKLQKLIKLNLAAFGGPRIFIK